MNRITLWSATFGNTFAFSISTMSVKPKSNKCPALCVGSFTAKQFFMQNLNNRLPSNETDETNQPMCVVYIQITDSQCNNVICAQSRPCCFESIDRIDFALARWSIPNAEWSCSKISMQCVPATLVGIITRMPQKNSTISNFWKRIMQSLHPADQLCGPT